MSEKLLKLLKFLLIFGLLCGFVVQILDSLEKYLDGKSSFATSENLKEQPEPLPSFSICSEPSFNAQFMKNNLNIPSNLFYLTSLNNQRDEFPKNLSKHSNNDYNLQYFWNQSILAPTVLGSINLNFSLLIPTFY